VAAFEGGLVFISKYVNPQRAPFIAYSGGQFKRYVALSPAAGQSNSDLHAGSAPFKSEIQVPGAAVGERGPCGPRAGSSSGVRPGNSSGRGDSPGSCIGGGTSGRGFPGGLSCGGSDGCPGLIGGSSCGSIGIWCFRHFTLTDQQRGAGNVPPRRTAR
jgi:hypothetical protein